MRIRLSILLIAGPLLVASQARAMDRWEALSMIESGDNDRAVGQHGEVSRFQILPELWPGGNTRNENQALTAAKEIMQPRLNAFERRHGRPATDFEFYVLWNAPWQAGHPTKAVTERARRFSILVRLTPG
jgi:hypothetical protein